MFGAVCWTSIIYYLVLLQMEMGAVLAFPSAVNRLQKCLSHFACQIIFGFFFKGERENSQFQIPSKNIYIHFRSKAQRTPIYEFWFRCWCRSINRHDIHTYSFVVQICRCAGPGIVTSSGKKISSEQRNKTHVEESISNFVEEGSTKHIHIIRVYGLYVLYVRSNTHIRMNTRSEP